MELLGGVLLQGEIRRNYQFRPLDGKLELAIAEQSAGGSSVSARVTHILASALEQLADEPVSRKSVAALSVGDRQFLMRQLSIHLGQDGLWLTTHCTACGKPFDLYVKQSKLPVKPAGMGYPAVEVDTSLGRLQFRVPAGTDQEAIASIAEEDKALRCLVRRLACGQEAEGQESSSLDELSTGDLRLVEQALETVAPEVGLAVVTNCPECSAANQVGIPPYLCLDLDAGQIYADIHGLAFHYHWSEPRILALPRARRKLYLKLIDRERGLSSNLEGPVRSSH
jgi:hypothetical protein